MCLYTLSEDEEILGISIPVDISRNTDGSPAGAFEGEMTVTIPVHDYSAIPGLVNFRTYS